MPRHKIMEFVASPKDSSTVSLFILPEYILLAAETVLDVHAYWKGGVQGLAWHLNTHSTEERSSNRQWSAYSTNSIG
jgi:hypothetical protein